MFRVFVSLSFSNRYFVRGPALKIKWNNHLQVFLLNAMQFDGSKLKGWKRKEGSLLTSFYFKHGILDLFSIFSLFFLEGYYGCTHWTSPFLLLPSFKLFLILYDSFVVSALCSAWIYVINTKFEVSLSLCHSFFKTFFRYNFFYLQELE